jgi:hypothetical protein
MLLPGLHADWPAGLITTADGSDEAALRRLFMCVDGNCDGAVDW